MTAQLLFLCFFPWKDPHLNVIKLWTQSHSRYYLQIRQQAIWSTFHVYKYRLIPKWWYGDKIQVWQQTIRTTLYLYKFFLIASWLYQDKILNWLAIVLAGNKLNELSSVSHVKKSKIELNHFFKNPYHFLKNPSHYTQVIYNNIGNPLYHKL